STWTSFINVLLLSFRFEAVFLVFKDYSDSKKAAVGSLPPHADGAAPLNPCRYAGGFTIGQRGRARCPHRAGHVRKRPGGAVGTPRPTFAEKKKKLQIQFVTA